jgi:peroxiredoxin
MVMDIPFYFSYAALWILVVLQGLILLGLVRVVYQLQRAGDAAPADSNVVGLQSGQIAPGFNTVDLSGTPISSNDLADRLTALLFVSPNCPSCVVTLYELEALNYKTQGNVIVICRAGREECAQLVERHKLNARTIADEDEQISRRFGVASFPKAVLIGEGYRVKSYGSPDRREIEELLDKAPETETEAEVSVQSVQEAVS